MSDPLPTNGHANAAKKLAEIVNSVTASGAVIALLVVFVLVFVGYIPSPYVSEGKAIERETLDMLKYHTAAMDGKLDTLTNVMKSQAVAWRMYCRSVAKTSKDHLECDEIGR